MPDVNELKGWDSANNVCAIKSTFCVRGLATRSPTTVRHNQVRPDVGLAIASAPGGAHH